MTTRLYRFRPLSRLLDKEELLNQEIFFASPDTLNDPMEGFRDVFWQGDSIVWKNLLRHYLLCLEWSCSFVLIAGESEAISQKDIPIRHVHEIEPTPQYKERISNLISEFQKNKSVNIIVEALSSRTTPIRREELIIYLQQIHTLSLLLIERNHKKHGFISRAALGVKSKGIIARAIQNAKQMIDIVEQVGANRSIPAETSATVLSMQYQMIEELKLLHLYNNAENPLGRNKEFILFEFPSKYTAGLERLVYPDWYTACFMKECQDSSVWGSYGDCHTAACLIFKVSEAEGISSIRLKRQYGYGNGKPMVGFTQHNFEEVIYENKHIPIDFFRMLGTIPTPVLMREWYMDEKGGKSLCADDIFRNEDEWRQRYWNTFSHGITRKLEAWHYEKEQRLILDGLFLDFSDPKDRVTAYDFADLEGIIFGIKTPNEKKIQICKIIEDKCRALNRTDFKFYQAYYSQEQCSIDYREMSFLKFKFT